VLGEGHVVSSGGPTFTKPVTQTTNGKRPSPPATREIALASPIQLLFRSVVDAFAGTPPVSASFAHLLTHVRLLSVSGSDSFHQRSLLLQSSRSVRIFRFLKKTYSLESFSVHSTTAASQHCFWLSQPSMSFTCTSRDNPLTEIRSGKARATFPSPPHQFTTPNIPLVGIPHLLPFVHV
jgi:hypothetical protein